MKKTYSIVTIVAFSLALSQTGCGKHGDALAMLALAGTLSAIKIARTDYRKPPPECTSFCDVCEVPCGDRCVPFGTICAAPQGSACKYNQRKVRTSQPTPQEGLGTHCGNTTNMLPLPATLY